MTSLEIGCHALEAVKPGNGGRGKKGGLREYAKAIGKDERNLRSYRDEAEVYLAVANYGHREDRQHQRIAVRHFFITSYMRKTLKGPAIWYGRPFTLPSIKKAHTVPV